MLLRESASSATRKAAGSPSRSDALGSFSRSASHQTAKRRALYVLPVPGGP